jgi:hypothetical protein
MIFNLTDKVHFPCLKQERAVLNSSRQGPCFGSGELVAFEEPFNGENKCGSFSGQDVYKITTAMGGINNLINQKSGNFTITELEVWQVEFKQQCGNCQEVL